MTKFTSSIGKGLSAATLDAEYQNKRRMTQRRNKPKHALYVWDFVKLEELTIPLGMVSLLVPAHSQIVSPVHSRVWRPSQWRVRRKVEPLDLPKVSERGLSGK